MHSFCRSFSSIADERYRKLQASGGGGNGTNARLKNGVEAMQRNQSVLKSVNSFIYPTPRRCLSHLRSRGTQRKEQET